MASNLTAIGRTTRVRGRVSGPGDLEVAGFIEGEIAMGGDVTVEPAGLVGASIQGRRVVVRGAVRGDVVGEEAVILEDGARVVGDVSAPRVVVVQGALVRGHVQTADEVPTAAASRAQASSKASVPRAVPAPLKPVVAIPARPVPRPASAIMGATVPAPPRAQAASESLQRRPPPPVVPAMKKVRGQILKKKER